MTASLLIPKTINYLPGRISGFNVVSGVVIIGLTVSTTVGTIVVSNVVSSVSVFAPLQLNAKIETNTRADK